MSLCPAIFFDRDGVVNLSPGPGYVKVVADFHLNPGIIEVLSWCKTQGFLTVLVTSQQGVGKGHMSQADLDAIHVYLQASLFIHGASFDAIQVCPHLAGTCTCRKPSPEMVFNAAAALGIDLAKSALIGDHDRDIQMARKAGIGCVIRLATDHPVHEPSDVLCYTLSEVLLALQQWHLDP